MRFRSGVENVLAAGAALAGDREASGSEEGGIVTSSAFSSAAAAACKADHRLNQADSDGM